MDSRLLVWAVALIGLATYGVATENVEYNLLKSVSIACEAPEGVQELKWTKDGVDVKTITNHTLSTRAVITQEKTTSKLTIGKTHVFDGGMYACAERVGADPINTFELYSDIRLDVEKSVNTVENEKLIVKCRAKSSLPLTVWWTIKPLNLTVETNITNVSGATISLLTLEEDGLVVPNGKLRVDNTQLDFAGEYVCHASNEKNRFAEITTTVRVKNKYAALWPFLGICAEVILLCTIILIYEKKRNKTEMDDSDTDQGGDTKHDNKDSNLRHRN